MFGTCLYNLLSSISQWYAADTVWSPSLRQMTVLSMLSKLHRELYTVLSFSKSYTIQASLTIDRFNFQQASWNIWKYFHRLIFAPFAQVSGTSYELRGLQIGNLGTFLLVFVIYYIQLLVFAHQHQLVDCPDFWNHNGSWTYTSSYHSSPIIPLHLDRVGMCPLKFWAATKISKIIQFLSK